MEKVTLGKTGLEVSKLGFGAGPIGYLETDQAKVEHIVSDMLEKGVNFIDTAASYPGSEQAMGQALKQRPENVVIASKCGHRLDALPGDAWSRELIEASVDLSLKRLGVDVLDIMLLHSCSLQVLEHGEAVQALERARDAGKVRFIGYSGDNEAAAYAASLEPFSVIEMSLNVVDQANLRSVLPMCRQRELGVIVKRPLANAAWKELKHQPGMYKQYAEVYTQRLAAMDLRPEALGYHGHADVEWPEIALRYAISHEGVHTAVAGTTSVTNARANIAAVSKGPLPDDLKKQIETAFDTAQQDAGQQWPAQV